ncbi:hypothetical protein ACWGF2_29770 [Streptomyces sp. NPDC054919]
MERTPDLLADGNFRLALDGVDHAKNRISALEKAVNRATRPEEIWTDAAQRFGTGPWHDDLTPVVAAERWKAVREAYDTCDALEAHWNALEAALEATKSNAAKAYAAAFRSGGKKPSTAPKIAEAEAELEGCSIALREAVNDLKSVRADYDALLKDRPFLMAYRAAVVDDFKKQRADAKKKFNDFAAALHKTRGRYDKLHDLTMARLGAVAEEDWSYLPIRGRGWLDAKLPEAVDTLNHQVTETDPLYAGDFLAEPLEEIAAVAKVRKAEIDSHYNAAYTNEQLLNPVTRTWNMNSI